MNITRLLTSIGTAAAVTVIGAVPAHAGQISPPKYRDTFDDNVCGIAAHVVISADNPIVETGRVSQSGEPLTVDSGHLSVRITNPANGHWMTDDFSGPALVIAIVANADGSVSKRVVFDGTKRAFGAWDRTVVADRGRLVVDYLIRNDEILSRTEVSRVGDFPIARGLVGFCDFATAHLT